MCGCFIPLLVLTCTLALGQPSVQLPSLPWRWVAGACTLCTALLRRLSVRQQLRLLYRPAPGSSPFRSSGNGLLPRLLPRLLLWSPLLLALTAWALSWLQWLAWVRGMLLMRQRGQSWWVARLLLLGGRS